VFDCELFAEEWEDSEMTKQTQTILIIGAAAIAYYFWKNSTGVNATPQNILNLGSQAVNAIPLNLPMVQP
jgi:hypothetical protein